MKQTGRTVLRKLPIVASVIALLTGPAFAQIGGKGLTPPDQPEKSQAQIEREKAAEKAYQSAVSRIPDAEQKSNDPWGDVRPTTSTTVKKKKPQ